jgi:hypothetical protein
MESVRALAYSDFGVSAALTPRVEAKAKEYARPDGIIAA